MTKSKKLDDYAVAYGDDSDYAFDNDIMLNWYPRRIIELSNRKSKVLELGIGHGYTCNHFAESFSQYLVIDGSEAVIARFKQQYPDSKACVTQSYFESYETNQIFDVIVMGFVLEHVDDPGQVLDYYKQFIAPNGRCFVTVPNSESLHRRFGHEAGLLPDMSTIGPGDQAFGHQRLYTVASMTRLLQSCGYQVIRTEGIFLKPLTTSQLRSLELSKEILDGMCEVGVAYPELSAGIFFEAEISV